jgi:phosphatidylserine decarboxylase
MVHSGAVDKVYTRLRKAVPRAKVTVYYFTEYHIVSDGKARSARPATRETIAQIDNAIVLEETAQEVETSQVDGHGFYHVEARSSTEGVV